MDMWFCAVFRYILLSIFILTFSGQLLGETHPAPIVLQGFNIRPATHYPISMYRLFRTNNKGEAVAIPFQIDEINELGDYVLPNGASVTAKTGNGIFDPQDELAFMGDDVGPAQVPHIWKTSKPAILYEIKIYKGSKGVGKTSLSMVQDQQKPGQAGREQGNANEQAGLTEQAANEDIGAVYIGIYFSKAPALSNRSYVNFYENEAEIVTSRYRYGFDKKNWLVARLVEMVTKPKKPKDKPAFQPLLNSTTFFMRADLKYFLTVEANQQSIQSQLEAFKVGPVRTIVRISFLYSFLKLNFELGMYTEISFFANAVYLPAIMHNPLEGPKSLNEGSGFYYGMSLKENPNEFSIETNMEPYKKSGILDIFKSKKNPEETYWVAAHGLNRLLYMEIGLSKSLREADIFPMFYRENISGDQIKTRGADKPSPLGKSPVNLGLYFDMTKFKEGDHIMTFKLFFENSDDPDKMKAFKTLSQWHYDCERINL